MPCKPSEHDEFFVVDEPSPGAHKRRQPRRERNNDINETKYP